MSPEPSKPGILLVDDDDGLAHALSRILESEGYRVRCAPDGEVAVRMASAEPPDLIIMDLMMPVKNGFEACRELQQIDNLRDVPILVLTAFGRNIGEIEGLGPDGDLPRVHDCLEKPIEPNVLLERIASALAGRR